MADVNGDGIDDGTVLPEIVIRGERNNNERTLNNIQRTLDVVGWIPGVQTVTGIANAGIDVARGNYGSALINLGTSIPVAGYLFKGAKIAAVTTKVVSNIVKMKVIKASIPLVLRKLQPAGSQIHHIIPKAVYKEHSEIFNQLKNFDIDNIGNLIPLNKGFHGNHPAYSEYVAKELTELADRTIDKKLTIQHINQVVQKMEGIIQNAHNSSLHLNDYIKTLK
ncbi:AHH domain-containing protein [Emticicia sp. TH156]|uniref:AHH domain-containing protein n=1 Tax=Emticicia sp. TH156 TaxID=2067454 RepID=UPI0038D50FBF